jgi:small subunit ribosomal protein S1
MTTPDDAASRRGDDTLERELAEALGSVDLESLIDLDVPRAGAAATAPGVRHGRVIAVQGDDIFVDMGGKSQGVIAAEQFDDEDLPAVGDTIEVTIERYDSADGLLILSRKGAVQAATWQNLEEGQIVEGRVTGHNKGGLELDINGIPGFMPISQIELFRVEELAPYVNRRLPCEVTEVRRSEKSVIVSRRDLLRREEEEMRQRTYETLAEGQTVKGVVKTIMPYGAFVDIGGIDGLLHIGDMSHARVEDPKDVVKEGQTIEVMVLKIDRDTRKIGLGLKQIMPDPWADAANKWPAETIVTGRVTRLMDFGAFVELEPGVEGLIPISEMSFERRIHHPREVVNEGDVVKVLVLQVDEEARRIGLSLKRTGDDPWVGASVRWPVDGLVSGTVKRIADFGAFVELAPGVEGLVHVSELSDQRVRMVSDVVREGQTVQAKVLDVDEERRRISLSIKQAVSVPEYTGQESAEPEAPRPAKKRKKPLKGGLDWGF